MYYRPEEWDELHPDAVKYVKARGLGAVLDYINESMRRAWKAHDNEWAHPNDHPKYDGDDMNNLTTICAYTHEQNAFGAYNALLCSCEDKTIWKHIYNWGHYSVFY